MEEQQMHSTAINVRKNRYPFCIVWGTLPLISWLLPFIGHLGICDSRGRVHDFAGPYTIGIDSFMTGKVLKYHQLNPDEVVSLSRRKKRQSSDVESEGEQSESSGGSRGGGGGSVELTPAEAWDQAIDDADAVYKTRMHNLFCDNCHDHVNMALNNMGIDGKMIPMFLNFSRKSRYVSVWRLAATYVPFLIIVAIIVVLTQTL